MLLLSSIPLTIAGAQVCEHTTYRAMRNGRRKRLLLLGAASVSLSQLEADVDRALSRPHIPYSENYHYHYHRTLRGKAKSLASTARQRSGTRQQQCEIQFGDILEMLLAQGGRCFYSGVPLQYDRVHVDWVMSLERLDNNCGYVRENCVLIAAEFNTPDHSKLATSEVQGSPQWSLAKAMHVWGHAGCHGFNDPQHSI